MAENAVAVLSREHGNLRDLFAKLRNPNVDRAAIWLEIVKAIATHIAVERTFVYPLIKRRRLGPAGLGRELRRDYRRMEHLLVLTDRRKINSPDMPGLVSVLLDAFEAHKERCATVVTPLMRDELTGRELEVLGVKMGAAENVILSHPHPYLLAAGPLYPWTTRLASIWDRARDRTVRNR